MPSNQELNLRRISGARRDRPSGLGNKEQGGYRYHGNNVKHRYHDGSYKYHCNAPYGWNSQGGSGDGQKTGCVRLTEAEADNLQNQWEENDMKLQEYGSESWKKS